MDKPGIARVDQEVRGEVDRLHSRVNELRDRVIMLEAQVPHNAASLKRIEESVEKMNGHIVKAIWLILALFIGIVFNFTVKGGFAALTMRGDNGSVAMRTASVSDVGIQYRGERRGVPAGHPEPAGGVRLVANSAP